VATGSGVRAGSVRQRIGGKPGDQVPLRDTCGGAELAFGAVSVFLRHRDD
jgi:hypothetical protein